jgi:hypothetical protein
MPEAAAEAADACRKAASSASLAGRTTALGAQLTVPAQLLQDHSWLEFAAAHSRRGWCGGAPGASCSWGTFTYNALCAVAGLLGASQVLARLLAAAQQDNTRDTTGQQRCNLKNVHTPLAICRWHAAWG